MHHRVVEKPNSVKHCSMVDCVGVMFQFLHLGKTWAVQTFEKLLLFKILIIVLALVHRIFSVIPTHLLLPFLRAYYEGKARSTCGFTTRLPSFYDGTSQ